MLSGHDKQNSTHMLKIILFLMCLVVGLIASKVGRPVLRGVTVEPFIYQAQNGTFKGFLIDLLDNISERVGFDYVLYISPDGKYGNGHLDGNTVGMIAQVYSKNANFALADFTITESRARSVSFTSPFMKTTLSALIRRTDAQNMTFMEHLLYRNMSYGTVKNSAIESALKSSNVTVGVLLGHGLSTTPVHSFAQGVELVQNGHFALIANSAYVDYVASQNCQLISLPDIRGIDDRKLAIALQSDSTYLHSFNRALAELKRNGTIEQLIRVHWSNRYDQKGNI